MIVLTHRMMEKNITTGQLTLITPTNTYVFPKSSTTTSSATNSPPNSYNGLQTQSPRSSYNAATITETSTAPSTIESRSDSLTSGSTPLTAISLASSRFRLKPGARATIKVTSDRFWLRLLTLGDLGFAEAYMAGECQVSRTDHEDDEDIGEGLLDVFKVRTICNP